MKAGGFKGVINIFTSAFYFPRIQHNIIMQPAQRGHCSTNPSRISVYSFRHVPLCVSPAGISHLAYFRAASFTQFSGHSPESTSRPSPHSSHMARPRRVRSLTCLRIDRPSVVRHSWHLSLYRVSCNAPLILLFVKH